MAKKAKKGRVKPRYRLELRDVGCAKPIIEPFKAKDDVQALDKFFNFICSLVPGQEACLSAWDNDMKEWYPLRRGGVELGPKRPQAPKSTN